MEVAPVFVLEGKAPKMKYNTIAARNALQFKGAKPKTDATKTGKDRSRFHFVLKQCANMLSYMGLACITGNGEAEAMCAYLNEYELVDGCISQDSDCFAYGANVVYKNFSISQQGAHAGKGGAVDIYDIRKAYANMGFGRNKVIALALLCGCDYVEGVVGVGKESTLKLFDTVNDEDILDRLRSWRKNKSLYEELERKISGEMICTSCGHNGKLLSHNKTGCQQCNTTKGCDTTQFKEKYLEIKNELNVRSKALADLNFPNEELIKEFLVKKDNVSKLDLKWKQPDMVGFVKFTKKYLEWEELYAFEKLLPILTRWQLLNHEYVEKVEINMLKGVLYPEKIKKKRNPKGIPSYEIIWYDKHDYFKDLIPTKQLENVDFEKLWTTIEPQILVEKAHPDIVYAFEQCKIKHKPTKRKNARATAVNEISDMLSNISVSEPKPKRKTKRKTKKEEEKSQEKTKTIDSYFRKAIKNNQLKFGKDDCANMEENCVANLKCSTPKLKNSYTMDISSNISSFEDEDDNLEISNVIENIINRKPLKIITENLQILRLQLQQDDNQLTVQENECSFFINKTLEKDLFEKTFEERFNSDYDMEEYHDNNKYLELGNKYIKQTEEKFNKSNGRDSNEKFWYKKKQEQLSESEVSDEEFCGDYVPLIERIKQK